MPSCLNSSSKLQGPNGGRASRYLVGHLSGSLTFLRILWASRFMTCFVNTPEERNLTPSFISSSNTFFPSSLMQVTFLSSITSSRPRRSAAASRHSLLSSAAHGAISLPSSTKPSTTGGIENGDLQHLLLLAPPVRAKPATNPPSRKSLNFQEKIARSRKCRMLKKVKESKLSKLLPQGNRERGGAQLKHTASGRC